MKIKTSIKNNKNGEPEFFTDENGFQWLPRRKVSKLGVEGNYYPITSSMFIQDDSKRLTLMTTHPQGATSFQNGELEIMLDRRTTYDDGRGMGEGVLDSVKMQHKFWLALEFFQKSGNQIKEGYQVPSIFAHHLTSSLNYPANVFFLNERLDTELQSQINLLDFKFSCDVNLVNLRSLSDSNNELLPSQSSLLILHRLGYDCQLINDEFMNRICPESIDIETDQFIRNVKIADIKEASLTGLEVGKTTKKLNQKTIAPMEMKTYFITYQ
jgi:alpha-mannosidase